MKQVLRWFLFLLLLALLSAVGGGVWVIQNEAKVEDAVLKSITSHLLTDAHIDEITLDIFSDFPHISLRLDQVSLLGSSENPSDTLLRADYLQLHCNAIELFRGNYQIESASIENGEVSIVSTPNGQWNTQVWKSDANEDANEAGFAFRELNLKNCTFIIDGTSFDIPDMRIEGGWNNAVLEAHVEGDLDRLRLKDMTEYLPSAQLQLSAQWNEETSDLSVHVEHAFWWGGDWHADAHFSEEEGWTSEGQFESIPFQTILPWMSLPKTLESLDFETQLSGNFNWDHEAFRAQIALPVSDWRLTFEGLNEPVFGQAQASIWAKYAAQRWRMDIPKWMLKFDGVELNGSLNNLNPQSGLFASSPMEARFNFGEVGALRSVWDSENLGPTEGKAHLTGSLTRETHDQLLAQMDWEFTDCMGDREGIPWEFRGKGSISPQTFSVQESHIRWGDHSFTTTASINDPMDWRPGKPIQGQVNLEMDSWSYIATHEDPIALTQLALPTDSRMDWTIRCNTAHVANCTLNNIEAQGRLEPLLWRLQRFRCETLDGQLTGDGQVLLIPEEDRAVIQLNPVVTQIDLPALFRAFDDFEQSTLRSEHLQGLLSASGSLQFDCHQSLAWDAKSFEMLGEASIANGALHRLEAFANIAEYLKENRMIAPLVNPEDLAQRLEDITFEPLSSALYVSGESVHLPEVQIRSSAMNISLEGSYTFDGTLDYTLGFSMRDLRHRGNGEFGPIEDDGLGQQFFIQMNGNVNSPDYSWDRKAQRNHRKNNFQREKELLKSLFKRS
jgi:hypothetical protein